MGMESEMEDVMRMIRNYEKARNEGIAPENLELEALLSAMKQEETDNGHVNLNISGSKNKDENVQREEIFPTAFFVVKTTNEKKQKVFINICGCDKVPGPGDWEEGIPPEVEEALAAMESDGDVVQNLRLPLSCSDPDTSTDNSGNSCLVYDVVYNLAVVRCAMDAKRLKLFVIDMAMTWIGQKYKTQLSSDFKVPNMKYKGISVRSQYIRAAPKGPLISEIPDDEAEIKPSFPLLISAANIYQPNSREEPTEGRKFPETQKNSPNSPEYSISLSQTAPVNSKPIPLCVPESLPVEQILQEQVAPETPQQKQVIPEARQKQVEPETMQQQVLPETLKKQVVPDTLEQQVVPEQQVEPAADEKPVMHTEHIGRPVEHSLLQITFPPLVDLEELSVLATNLEICVHVAHCTVLQVALLFLTSSDDIEAELSLPDRMLTLKLPFHSYKNMNFE